MWSWTGLGFHIYKMRETDWMICKTPSKSKILPLFLFPPWIQLEVTDSKCKGKEWFNCTNIYQSSIIFLGSVLALESEVRDIDAARSLGKKADIWANNFNKVINAVIKFQGQEWQKMRMDRKAGVIKWEEVVFEFSVRKTYDQTSETSTILLTSVTPIIS